MIFIAIGSVIKVYNIVKLLRINTLGLDRIGVYNMKEQESISFKELIHYVKNEYKKQYRILDEKYIYTENDINSRDKQIDDLFYIDDRPDVLEDSDVYSSFVEQNNLTVFCSGRDLIDVFANAINQKANVTDMELLDALQYYLEVDGFYTFGVEKEFGKYLAIFPNVTNEEMMEIIHNFGEVRLRKYTKYFSTDVSVIVSDDTKASLAALCQVVARQRNMKTLSISMTSNCWNHYLYQDNKIISPAKYILPGQERRKNPKMGMGPIAKEFISFSLDCKEHIIELYLKAASNDEEVKKECMMKDGQYFIRERDSYPVGDGRQAFDFLSYLGFHFSTII